MANRSRRGGIRLARVFGIEIRLDLSLLIIFGLITYSLGAGIFYEWHPDWTAALRWGVALGAGVLFFAALLAHELAHSVVALLYGIAVPRITLFMFGGVSELSEEPKTPASELWIALAGPAMSLALGLAFTVVGSTLAGPEVQALLATDPEQAIALLSPAATLLMWLGPVSIVLAVFNLMPGFPMDGGRVLRALLWWVTGNRTRATAWATASGRSVAWVLVVFGLMQVAGGALGGLWLVVMGWFLHSAARNSYDQELIRQVVDRIQISDLMRTRFQVVDADMALPTFVEDHLLRSGQPSWPVVEGGRPVGMIGLDEVRATPTFESRQGLRVRDVMRPLGEPVSPKVSGREALQRLAQDGTEPLPVMRDGEIVGLLFGADVASWLALHRPEDRAA